LKSGLIKLVLALAVSLVLILAWGQLRPPAWRVPPKNPFLPGEIKGPTESSLNRGLAGAVKSRDLKKVNDLLARGADPNALDSEGISVLAHAAARGNLQILQALVEHGADVRARDRNGDTPLLSAVTYPLLDVAVVKFLVEHGADLNAENHGWNVLRGASYLGNPSVVRFLLDQGVDVNGKDQEGQTALMAVSKSEFWWKPEIPPLWWQPEKPGRHRAEPQGVMQVLLDHGAQINAQDEKGRTALMLATARPAIKFLVDRGADLNVKNRDGKTALMLAEDQGRRDVAAQLSLAEAKGPGGLPETQVRQPKEMAAHKKIVLNRDLMMAVSDRNLGWVSDLLALGADPNALNDRTGLFVFDMALGSPQIAQIFLDHGADINGKDRSGVTALMRESFAGNLAAVKFLLDHAADVNARDDDGRTAIIYWHRGNLQVMQLLLDHGADVNAKDWLGRTALYVETTVGGVPNTGVMQLLLDHGADVDAKDRNGSTPLMNLTYQGQLGGMLFLLTHGADVNAQDNAGRTALRMAEALPRFAAALVASEMLWWTRGRQQRPREMGPIKQIALNRQLVGAVISRDLQKVNDLLAGGADPEAREDYAGEALLAFTTRRSNLSMLLALLEHGAAVNAKDLHSGSFALDIAAFYGNLPVVEALLAHGAEVDARTDILNETPLMAASSQGHGQVVEYLLAHGAEVNATNKKGETALKLAGKNGSVVEALLRAGAMGGKEKPLPEPQQKNIGKSKD
jgi:serine/threonine-protein phosphatase 6 regulatory ankyrin repeat subunit B